MWSSLFDATPASSNGGTDSDDWTVNVEIKGGLGGEVILVVLGILWLGLNIACVDGGIVFLTLLR